jgi:Asp-tRNA(Asn)/Glu-tRNA(Gln) amidotransferase A subunit family amidase
MGTYLIARPYQEDALLKMGFAFEQQKKITERLL